MNGAPTLSYRVTLLFTTKLHERRLGFFCHTKTEFHPSEAGCSFYDLVFLGMLRTPSRGPNKIPGTIKTIYYKGMALISSPSFPGDTVPTPTLRFYPEEMCPPSLPRFLELAGGNEHSPTRCTPLCSSRRASVNSLY